MRPRADEILRSVVATYEEYILPEVSEPFARSIALTLANLMRHVALRIEQEGPDLDADNEELRQLLSRLHRYCCSAGEDRLADLERWIADVSTPAGVSTPGAPGPAYRNLADLIDEATELRWVLQKGIRLLESLRPELGGSPEYEEIRSAIRRYLKSSLAREMALIVPAFTGERR